MKDDVKKRVVMPLAMPARPDSVTITRLAERPRDGKAFDTEGIGDGYESLFQVRIGMVAVKKKDSSPWSR
jgi:hypothetical protein